MSDIKGNTISNNMNSKDSQPNGAWALSCGANYNTSTTYITLQGAWTMQAGPSPAGVTTTGPIPTSSGDTLIGFCFAGLETYSGTCVLLYSDHTTTETLTLTVPWPGPNS
jgi:hypothetical protein